MFPTTDSNTPALSDNFQEFERWRQAPEQDSTVEPNQETEEGADESETTTEGTSGEASKPAPHSDAEEGDQDQPERKGGRGVQRRIDQLTRKIHELEATLAAKPAAGEEQSNQPGHVNPPAEQAGKPVAPKSTDFMSWAEYEKAQADYIEKLADWKAEQRDQKQAATARQQQAQEVERTRMQRWTERVTAFKSDHADYDDVISTVELPQNAPSTMVVREALLESEIGPAITYHLAQHPDEVKEILAMPPVRAAAAIGRLEAKLSGTTAPDKPATSRASKPPVSITSGKAPRRSIHDEAVVNDYATWERMRNAQLRFRR